MGCDLSIILPSYRGGAYVCDSLRRIEEALATSSASWEVVIVDDGSHDVVIPPGANELRVRVLAFAHNRGKGAAVRAGMLSATGATRVYTDVDLPFGTGPILEAHRLIAQEGWDAVLGDRTLPTSRYATDLPLGRRLLSGAFTQLVGRIVLRGHFDTQCGFKAFRGDVAQAVYGLSRTDRFAQDLEITTILLENHMRIRGVPVRLERDTASTLRLARDSVVILRDVLRICWFRVTGAYGAEQPSLSQPGGAQSMPHGSERIGNT